jgi:Peptidase family M28
VIEPRIYRAAFLPALFVIVLVAFSLVSTPKPLDQGLAADELFTGDTQISAIREIVDAQPDRRAGGPGDRAIAGQVAATFRTSGFTTTIDRFEDEDRQLVNVIGRRAGESSKQIVVVAARDSARRIDATGSAADTAALMQLSRVFEGRALERTLVLASVDGRQLGDAGARRFAEKAGGPGQVAAVIVLSDLGAPKSRGPIVIGWSNDTTRAGMAFQRTVSSSLRQELGRVPGQEGTIAQFVRLAFPVAPGGQAPMLDEGLDAVRVSGAGEVSGGGSEVKDVNVDRYGALGRSVLRMISTLDSSSREPARGEASYVTVAGTLLPAWVLKLLALALILPALVASIDALARARRRREPVLPWVGWLASAAIPFVLAVLVAWFMVLVGLIEDAPPAPLDPPTVELDATAISALVATSFTAVLAWLLIRTRVLRRRAHVPDATAPGAACVTSLALSLVAIPVALLNPFAALMLVPALHLWMLATLTDIRTRPALVLAAVGFAPVLFVVLYYMVRFELSPLRGAWYFLLLVTGNQTGLLTTVALCALLAITASVGTILIARARRAEEPRGGRRARGEDEERPSIFGPGGHAGPGMIGAPGSGARR